MMNYLCYLRYMGVYFESDLPGTEEGQLGRTPVEQLRGVSTAAKLSGYCAIPISYSVLCHCTCFVTVREHWTPFSYSDTY